MTLAVKIRKHILCSLILFVFMLLVINLSQEKFNLTNEDGKPRSQPQSKEMKYDLPSNGEADKSGQSTQIKMQEKLKPSADRPNAQIIPKQRSKNPSPKPSDESDSKGKLEPELQITTKNTATTFDPHDVSRLVDATKYFYKSVVTPDCDDVTRNLTDGRWVHWKNYVTNSDSEDYKILERDEKRLDDFMNAFRIQRGIHTKLWRDDLKCGIFNYQTKPKVNAWGGSVGAWCDAKSEHPCCSDENNGICGMTCDCERCIDMRKILHAEFSKWIPSDERCVWKNYTSDEACQIIQKFNEIHFIGDSFIRKMARILFVTLRNDRSNGFELKRYDERKRKFCVADYQLFWTECMIGGGNFQSLLVNESPVCGMDLSRFTMHGNNVFDAGTKALALAKKFAGVPGTLILLAVGTHMRCAAEKTKDLVLLPFKRYLDEFYSNTTTPPPKRWPQFIFLFPDTPDVLKSTDHRAANGKVPCYKFSDKMIEYLLEYNIPYLDFRKLTSDVHSYDGTHHGIAVNVMKVQILLNYLNTLTW